MREWISAERLSDFIGAIYQCAIDPARWPDTIEAIRVLLGCENAGLTLQRLPDYNVVLDIQANVPARYGALVAGSGMDLAELWGGEARVAAAPIGEPMIQSRMNPDFEAAKTTNRYFVEFKKPQGLSDTLAIVLARDAHAIGVLAFGRLERDGDFTPREIAIARLLAPHLQRAATINRLLEQATRATAGFASVVDRLVVPVVITDASGMIAHVNPTAAALLAVGDPLATRDSALRGATIGVDRALSVAIQAVCGAPSAIERKGMEIPAHDGDGTAWVLHIIPVTDGPLDRPGDARAAVFARKAQVAFVPAGELLAALFGLTPAEARVFAALAAGHDPSRIAERLGVAPSTIKTHIGRLFRKTGARRQSELVQIAASLAPPVG